MRDSVWLGRAVVLLAAGDVVLGAALAAKALERPPLRVVPGVAEERVVLPHDPDGRSIVNFAQLCAINLDNFTPETRDAQESYVLSRVAPGLFSEMERSMAQRRAMAEETRMASSLVVRPDTVALERSAPRRFEVSFRAVRRHYVTDRLSWDDEFEYRVGVEVGHPTASNPAGLFLCSLGISRVKENAR